MGNRFPLLLSLGSHYSDLIKTVVLLQFFPAPIRWYGERKVIISTSGSVEDLGHTVREIG